MKFLFATTNQAKVLKYREAFEENGIELITIKDLDFKLDIEETGKNAIENAYIKAKAYYDATHIPTIGMDDNLFIEELPENMQPGTYVRRVNGKELTDDEMIMYYTDLVKKHGGKLNAKWISGVVIYDNNGSKEFSWSTDNFYFVDKPSKKRNPGYPLDSISIIPEYGKYSVDLSKEEKTTLSKKNCINEDIQFILNNIKNYVV